jgi:hypothetical protein
MAKLFFMKPVIVPKSTRSKAYISRAKATNSVVSNANKKLLLHQVFFWLKNPDSIEDRDLLVKGISTLSAIETVRKLHVGLLASTEKREVVDTSWQVSELMFFDDTNGQKVYQDHPLHHAFIDKCSHLWSRVLVYDAVEA